MGLQQKYQVFADGSKQRDIQKKTLRLFKGVVVERKSDTLQEEKTAIDSEKLSLFRKALNNAVYIEFDILEGFTYDDAKFVVDYAISLYGVDNLEVNSTFYKQFEDVKQLSDAQLVINQLTHYFSVYSSDKEYMWEPKEVSESLIATDNTEDYVVTRIKAIDKEELSDSLNKILSSGIALDSNKIQDIIDICDHFSIHIDLETIQNKEAMMHMCYKLGMVPKDTVEFIRYLVFLTTGQTLLIKDSRTIDSIKANVGGSEYRYLKHDGIEDPKDLSHIVDILNSRDDIELAKVFNRFKPIFLAFKSNKDLKTKINRVSKLSKKHHKPHKQPVLTTLTTFKYSKDEVAKASSNANVFQLIKAYNAINLYMWRALKGNEFIGTYKIRNGKTYTKTNSINATKESIVKASDYSRVLYLEIARRLYYKIQGKTIVLPPSVDYKLPTSLKTMVGSVPNFTSFDIPKDETFIIGATWKDNVDIDISATTINGVSLGWFTKHKSEGITHSGDMVSLNKHGVATEAFEITKESPSLILGETLYSGMWHVNGDEKEEFNYKMFISLPKSDTNIKGIKQEESIGDFSDVLHVVPMVSEYKAKSIGVYNADKNQFILVNQGIQGINNRMISHSSARETLEGLLDIHINTLSLREVLSGYNDNVKIVESIDGITEGTRKNDIINLELDSIDDNTFIDLLS